MCCLSLVLSDWEVFEALLPQPQ